MREAKEHQEEDFKAPALKIADVEELAEYRLKKRKEYEDLIRRVYWNESVWVKYAKWEESQKDFARARSVWERALDHHHRSVSIWLKYAEMEMANRFVNHARNVWDRAVTLLPRVDQLWYKYVHMEEMLGMVANARVVFERWMRWEPDHNGWNAYVRFETRYKEWDLARKVYERYCACHPSVKAFVRWAKFEFGLGEIANAREVYERAVAVVPPATEKRYWRRYIYLWINYALFEELEAKDNERAREVYRECLKLVPHASFSFSKIWILAAKFEIRRRKLAAARKILGVAIGLAPKAKIFETYVDMEMQLGNVDRCRVLYQKALEANPTDCGTWTRFANLECELGETERARAVFELATARDALDAPEILWKAYVDFEIEQGERARARALYERLLDRTKHVKVWMSYAQFENAPLFREGGDAEDDGERAGAESRGVDPSEADPEESSRNRERRARDVYERALLSLKETQPDAKEERVMLLEAWRAFEAGAADGDAARVEKKMPRRVKRKRAIFADDGAPAGQEEYYDYIFPEEQGAAPNLKILEAAYAWKKRRTE